jgi:hypothetical protein
MMREAATAIIGATNHFPFEKIKKERNRYRPVSMTNGIYPSRA